MSFSTMNKSAKNKSANNSANAAEKREKRDDGKSGLQNGDAKAAKKLRIFKVPERPADLDVTVCKQGKKGGKKSKRPADLDITVIYALQTREEGGKEE
jgi:hypothetical protein